MRKSEIFKKLIVGEIGKSHFEMFISIKKHLHYDMWPHNFFKNTINVSETLLDDELTVYNITLFPK